MPSGIWENRKREKLSEEHKEKMRQAKLKNPVKYWLGKKRDKKTLEAMKISQFKKGHTPWIKGKHPIAWNAGKKAPQISKAKMGDKNPMWRGGINEINNGIRKTGKYRNWRKTILERDDFRCFDCGEKNKNLEVNHIYPFSLYPTFRLNVNNGETLCIDCHKVKTTAFKNKSNILIYV